MLSIDAHVQLAYVLGHYLIYTLIQGGSTVTVNESTKAGATRPGFKSSLTLIPSQRYDIGLNLSMLNIPPSAKW